MVSLPTLLTFALASMALIVIPGPTVLFVIGRSLALGRLGGFNPFDNEYLRDPLGMLNETALHQRRQQPREARPAGPPPELRAALDVMGLEWPVDQPGLRTRYRELAKRFHPDSTGGDREAEEKLKDVNRAYSLLRQRLAALTAAGQPDTAAAG